MTARDTSRPATNQGVVVISMAAAAARLRRGGGATAPGAAPVPYPVPVPHPAPCALPWCPSGAAAAEGRPCRCCAAPARRGGGGSSSSSAGEGGAAPAAHLRRARGGSVPAAPRARRAPPGPARGPAVLRVAEPRPEAAAGAGGSPRGSRAGRSRGAAQDERRGGRAQPGNSQSFRGGRGLPALRVPLFGVGEGREWPRWGRGHRGWCRSAGLVPADRYGMARLGSEPTNPSTGRDTFPRPGCSKPHQFYSFTAL